MARSRRSRPSSGRRGGGSPVLELTVTAHDKSHKMHRKTTTRTFKQTTVTDIARKMAGEHGLKVGKLATVAGGAAEERHQVGETDWQYLSNIVRRHGGELDVSRGRAARHRPDEDEVGRGQAGVRREPPALPPARLAASGRSRRSRPSAGTSRRRRRSSAPGTLKASTTVLDAKVNGAVSGTEALLAGAHVSTAAEAKAWAKAAAARLGHERVQGTAIATGDPTAAGGRVRRHRRRRQALRRHAQDRLRRPYLRRAGLYDTAHAGRRRPAAGSVLGRTRTRACLRRSSRDRRRH